MASNTQLECDECGSRWNMATSRVMRNPDGLTCPECGADASVDSPDDGDSDPDDEDDGDGPTVSAGGVFGIGTVLPFFLA